MTLFVHSNHLVFGSCVCVCVVIFCCCCLSVLAFIAFPQRSRAPRTRRTSVAPSSWIFNYQTGECSPVCTFQVRHRGAAGYVSRGLWIRRGLQPLSLFAACRNGLHGWSLRSKDKIAPHCIDAFIVNSTFLRHRGSLRTRGELDLLGGTAMDQVADSCLLPCALHASRVY